MKLTFIQTGDFHLDCPLGIFENSPTRKTELLETISLIFKEARNKKVDFLFLTGDIFDNDYLSRESLDFLRRQMDTITDTRIYISPGNHDYIGRSSAYVSEKWPDNVYIFKNTETIEDKGILITGTAFRALNEKESLLGNSFFNNKGRNKDKFNIIISHGGPNLRSYNPMTNEELKEYNLALLGHIHNYQIRENISYAGAPYSRNFSEEGPHGYIYGEILKGEVKLNFIELPGRSYKTVEVNLLGEGEIRDNESLKALIEDRLNNEGATSEDVIRVRLTGFIERGSFLNAKYIESKLTLYPHLKIDFSRLRLVSEDDLEGENSLLRKYMEEVDLIPIDGETLIEDVKVKGEEIRRLAKDLGVKALSGFIKR